MIGQTISHYRILEKLGGGGMGVVYKAEDTRLGRCVALKFLPEELSRDPHALERFQREARAASSLNHPHICTVHDIDEHEGRQFIVMELLEGKTLKQRICGQPLLNDEIASWGIQIVEALGAAHSKGIVHRDIKPANIFITETDQVKVLDFGLAKLLQPVSEATLTVDLSALPVVVGTLPYMAPEQLRAQNVDARADLYALGVVFYEMAAGRRPFHEQSLLVLSDDILHCPPPLLARLNPNLLPRLDDIILKCLEKDPENRYQSAKELEVDLRRLATRDSAASVEFAAKTRRRLRHAILLSAISIASIAAMVFITNTLGWRSRLFDGAQTPRIESLAVLPLENLSQDPAEEYFADGMTDALITDLGKIGALRVISRTSVMRYKGTKKNLQEIAKELHVDAIVEGSVTRSGDQVRIGANLVRASPETHLWAESYERDLRDVLSLQSDLAQAIAHEVQVKLTAQEQSRLATTRPVNPEAYQLYLKGRFYWNKRTQEGFTKAVEHFQRAIEIDPGYAVAYADLGAVYKQFAYYGIVSPQKSYLMSAEPAKKALQLDDSLAEAHTVMATLKEEHDRDWSAAENEYKRGIELNPNYATAHHWYALFLLRMGRLDESRAEVERALQLDPGSLIISKTAGDPDYFERRYDRAMKQYRKTLDMDPNFYIARLFLGYGYEQKGQLTEAVAEFQRARQSDDDPAVLGALGHAYAMLGRTRETHDVLDEMRRSKRYVSPYHIAIIHVGLRENDQAFEWLGKAYQDGGPWLLYLKVDPRLDGLRSDSRYTDLLRHLRLPL